MMRKVVVRDPATGALREVYRDLGPAVVARTRGSALNPNSKIGENQGRKVGRAAA